jgi:hypothetical protein
MVKRVLSVFLGVLMLACSSLAMAGGPPVYSQAVPCPTGPYGRSVPYSNYWGDAPFPGLCGGVVALPFLVVGSLLGGNTMAPYGPAQGGAYNCAPRPCPPAPCAPMSYAPISCAPAPAAYVPGCAPTYAQGCAPAYAPGCGPAAGGGLLGGLPCVELCSNLLGAVTGGALLVP